ncbi:YggT family protein [Bermanella marisrubri]|uniref:YggT family protein n=1 Tax=Bermanella marisrubri TaxID=207949 RepID=Q1N436_9GAMM|nr:YggT family protein [Bermanella marisrubri]EAT13029.1 hypothetical protein RED65_15072 [Oceanobacter sp. RED65] [Bermanella marisrubri]QIZ82846.1 YggT family protein [Bermanella marisrubri]
MDVSSQIGLMVINTIAGLYLFIVVLRFLLQAARANFYNPISQFVVKATAPVLNPLRKIVPGFGGFDWASIVLAVVVQMLAIGLSLLVAGYGTPVEKIIIWSLLGTVGLFLKLYFWGILIMVISSWIAPQSSNPALELLHQIIEPVMKPIRKVMPDMGGLDLSPIIAFLLINICNVILANFVMKTGAPGFIIGL